jgi:prenyltransferase beta subunit
MVIRRPVLFALLMFTLSLNIFGAEAANAAPATPTPAARVQKRLAHTSVLTKGLAWIVTQQDKSGGFSDSRGDIDPGVTSETLSMMIALGNAGVNIKTAAAVAYLQKTAPANVDLVTGGDAKVVVALVGAGADPRDAGGVDLVARVVASWDANAGIYGTRPAENVYALMALAVTNEKIEDGAIEALAAAQNNDGSWAFAGSGPGDAVMTAFVIQTLVAVGHGDDKAIANGVDFLHTAQTESGAFGIVPGSPPDSNTTGFVISALIASGESAKSSVMRKAVAGLLTFQNEDGGFRYNDMEPQDDILSTIPALTALAGAYLPVLSTKWRRPPPGRLIQSRPNQRARRLAPKTVFSARSASEGAVIAAVVDGPLRKLTSTRPTLPCPTSR